MSNEPDPDRPNLQASLYGLVVRPEIGLWTLAFIVLGELAAFAMAPDEWSVLRRVSAGVLFGVGATFCLLLPRMIGGRDYN